MHTPKNGFFYMHRPARPEADLGRAFCRRRHLGDARWTRTRAGRWSIPRRYYDRQDRVRLSPGEGGGTLLAAHRLQPQDRADVSAGQCQSPPTRYIPRPHLQVRQRAWTTSGCHHFVQHAPQRDHRRQRRSRTRRSPKTYLLAWDPVAQKAAWKVSRPRCGVFWPPAGNLVFQGHSRNVQMGSLAALPRRHRRTGLDLRHPQRRHHRPGQLQRGWRAVYPGRHRRWWRLHHRGSTGHAAAADGPAGGLQARWHSRSCQPTRRRPGPSYR